MHGNGDDGAVPGMVKMVVAAPDTNHLEASFLLCLDCLLPGDSREFHIPALPVFWGMDEVIPERCYREGDTPLPDSPPRGDIQWEAVSSPWLRWWIPEN